MESILTHQAIQYTWRQLATRAGVVDCEWAEWGFRLSTCSVCYGFPQQFENIQGSKLIVRPCNPGSWREILHREPQSLSWVPIETLLPEEVSFPHSLPMPVLFWSADHTVGTRPAIERIEPESVVWHIDVIATALFMLSRWEEFVSDERDVHARFPAATSVAYRQGFLDRPIVDEYALVLRAWLQLLLPGWTPQRRTFRVQLTHDVDSIRRASSARKVIRKIGGDIVKRRNLRLAWQTLTSIRKVERDPDWLGIRRLIDVAHQYGLDIVFYLMAAAPSDFDDGYDLGAPELRACVDYLLEQDVELGLHAGYYTLNNPQKLAEEKTRLDRILGTTAYGGRQHYLRFETPATWRHWEQVGLTYDATMGYADQPGFRCGTCHAFQPFDLETGRQLDLSEKPLIVMERNLERLAGRMSQAELLDRVMQLAQRCREVEGTFVILWHNQLLSERWQSWGEMYRQLLSLLEGMK